MLSKDPNIDSDECASHRGSRSGNLIFKKIKKDAIWISKTLCQAKEAGHLYEIQKQWNLINDDKYYYSDFLWGWGAGQVTEEAWGDILGW